MRKRIIIVILLYLIMPKMHVNAEVIYYNPLGNFTDYYISSYFGERLNPITLTTEFHKGIDLACQQGTPVYSAIDGIVTNSYYSESGGNMVVIEDSTNSVVTRYLHLQQFIVSDGQEVLQGDLIGYVGTTGQSTGPHLHFDVNENGNYMNPQNYINFANEGILNDEYEMKWYLYKHETGVINMHILGVPPFKIYKCYDGVNYELVHETYSNKYRELGLDNGESVYYRVVDFYGKAHEGRYTPFVPTYNFYPLQVVQIMDDQVHLKWFGVDFKDITIYLNDNPIVQGFNSTEYTITGLEPNKEYIVYIKSEYDVRSNTITFKTTDELTKIEQLLTKLFIPDNTDSNSDGVPDYAEPIEQRTNELIDKLTGGTHQDIITSLDDLVNDTSLNQEIPEFKVATEWMGMDIVILDFQNPLLEQYIDPIRNLLVAILTVSCIFLIVSIFDIQFKV